MTVPGEEEFVAFYEAQWPKLLAALAWSVPDGEDPQDVAQEAFARAFEHWSKLREHPRPDAWLFLTGYRLATSLRRRVMRRHSQADQTAMLQPEDSFQAILVEDLLATIPPRQRAALLMRHYYGLSTRQAAQAMRCREGTVKSLLARGRERLRLSLSEGELDR